jgi:hypothetical protein
MKPTKVINNRFTLAHCNGHYYIYTVTVVRNNIYVNFDRADVQRQKWKIISISIHSAL